MKTRKILCLVAALLLLVSTLCACGNEADTSKWQSNETFESVPVYKYADTSYAEFSSAMNVKIEETSYDDFVEYISDLKSAGFSYLQNGNIPENYSLSNNSASWRCTNGKVWLQLIFNENEAPGYEMFGCNLQIYGYNSSSFLVPETTKKDSKNEDKKSGKNSKTEDSTKQDKTNSK